MKRTFKKVCSLLLVFLLFMSATFPSGFNFDGMLKAFADSSNCTIFKEAEFVNGDYAYKIVKWKYSNQEAINWDGEYKPKYYEGAWIVDYHGSETNLVVPEYLDGNPVIGIAIGDRYGYCTHKENKKKIESVTLPPTLKVIYSYAFKNMTSLKTVTMTDSVEQLGSEAFYGCTNLKNINLSKNIMSFNLGTFAKCTSLESVVLPERLTKVYDSSFEGCSSLTSVTFNQNLRYIGRYAFQRCNLETVELKENVEEIRENAFAYNVNLKSITLSENLEFISEGFIGGTAVEELHIPKNVTKANGSLIGSKVKTVVVSSKSIQTTKKYSYDDELFGPNVKVETLTLENTDIVEHGLNIPTVKTLIYNGSGEIDKIPFCYDSATENYIVPETVIFTDGFNINMHRFLMDTMNYHFHTDPETGYDIYSKEYSGEEEFRPLGNSFVSGEYTYDLTAGGGAVITDYSGTSTEVVTVPASFENEGVEYPVVAIGYSAFAATPASEYVLPDTIKRIGTSAFESCDNLTVANIPNSVTVLEPRAFANCKELTEIIIPDSVVFVGDHAFSFAVSSTKIVIPSSVKAIGSYAFYNNCSVALVTIDEGIEMIDSYAFSNDLKTARSIDSSVELVPYTLTLPSTLKEIGAYSFYNSCISGELVIPGGITVIPENAFHKCRFVTSVIINNGVKELGSFSFYLCKNATSFRLPSSLEIIGESALRSVPITSITIPSSVTHLGNNAFRSTDLSSVTIPPGITYLGEDVFSHTDLLSITIPSHIKTIGVRCFSECKSLKTIIIEEGVEYIDYEAFSHLGSVESIVIPKSMVEIAPEAFKDVETIDNVFFNAVCYEYDLRYYDDDVETNGDQDENYNVTINYGGRFAGTFEGNTINKIIIGESVKYFPVLFLYDATVGEVVLPDNIVAIGEDAFGGCTVGKHLVLPESVVGIYNDAFFWAVLPEITLPRNLKIVEEYAFYASEIEKVNYNCINCKFEVSEKTEIEGIYESPFTHNDSLKTIVINDCVEKIPDFLFCSLSGLETIYIHSGITSLGKGVFAFSGVKSVTGFEGMEEIEDYTFYGCKNLTEFDVSNLNVTDIGYYAFANSSLETFKGSDLLESIGDSCFEGCANLKTVDLGSKIMLIDANTFANCTSLTEITIPDTVRNIGKKAFYGNTALKSVKMSDNVIFIPDECFNGCSALSTFIWNPHSKLIGRLAFANCVDLTEFDFVNLEKLYDNSFLNSGVTAVQLGEAKDESVSRLEEIETQSFKGCENLATVGIGGNVETIKTQAFADCLNLETAVIADSVTEIAADAFDGCDKLTIYCSKNSYAHTYAQTQGIRVSTFVIAPIPNQTYTGFEIKPEISVSASGDKLAENVDFGVTYANNINVGNADVTVKGKGDFRMFASKAKFTIVTKNISAVTVAPIADQPYTGTAVTPEITVTDGIKVLREGTDYTVTYANNVNEGTATATITGKGNYSGTATTNFQVSKEAEEPGFFAKIFSSISSFFARIISFFASIFN